MTCVVCRVNSALHARESFTHQTPDNIRIALGPIPTQPARAGRRAHRGAQAALQLVLRGLQLALLVDQRGTVLVLGRAVLQVLQVGRCLLRDPAGSRPLALGVFQRLRMHKALPQTPQPCLRPAAEAQARPTPAQAASACSGGRMGFWLGGDWKATRACVDMLWQPFDSISSGVHCVEISAASSHVALRPRVTPKKPAASLAVFRITCVGSVALTDLSHRSVHIRTRE